MIREWTYLLAALLGLVFGSRLVVGGFEVLVRKLSNETKWVLAAILVALGTSFPELFLAIISGTSGQGEISLGNVLGANVVNVSLVVGLTATLMGSLAVVGEFLSWELSAAFLCGASPILLLLDGSLSRLDGVILLVIYLIYLVEVVIAERHKTMVKGSIQRVGFLYRLKQLEEGKGKWAILEMIFGFLLMFWAGNVIVEQILRLSKLMNVSAGFLGLMILSLGTTLPELVFSVESVKRKEITLVFGNLLGSVVTNSTLIVGILALLQPLNIAVNSHLALSNIAFVLLFGLFWLLVSTKRKLERWEGVILVGGYLMFVGWVILMR